MTGTVLIAVAQGRAVGTAANDAGGCFGASGFVIFVADSGDRLLVYIGTAGTLITDGSGLCAGGGRLMDYLVMMVAVSGQILRQDITASGTYAFLIIMSQSFTFDQTAGNAGFGQGTAGFRELMAPGGQLLGKFFATERTGGNSAAGFGTAGLGGLNNFGGVDARWGRRRICGDRGLCGRCGGELGGGGNTMGI